MSRKIKVLQCAITSRLIILGLQVFLNAVIEDHDAGVFLKPGASKTSSMNDVERCLHFLLEGLERWDGQYFLNVAEHGYVYEKTLAFFPLFPLLTRLVASTLLCPLRLLVSEHLVLLASATLLNQAAFCAAAVIVYLLGRELLASTDNDMAIEQRAYKAALLFCYNPASIFFSAAYSESTFSLITFAGMLLVERGSSIGATAAFALSALVRSNGTVNAGFLLYAAAIKPLMFASDADDRHRSGKTPIGIATIVGRLALGTVQALVVIASFALFQLYAYEAFCVWPRPTDLSDEVVALNARDPNEYVLPGSGGAWCHSHIPVSYGYVQTRYWNVGFFRYFEARQIPNFILAAPAVLVCLHGIFRYAIRLLKALARHIEGHDPILEKPIHLRVLPYIVHCSFLLVFGVMSMHVQVITRLVASSTPFFYLFAAAMLPDLPAAGQVKNGGGGHRQQDMAAAAVMLMPQTNGRCHKGVLAYLEDQVPLLSYWPRRKHLKRKSKLVLAYFAFYFVTGTACFANFLPWT